MADEPLPPITDPVLSSASTAPKYPVSRYSHGPSRLPSQIYLSHTLHRYPRGHIFEHLLAAARQGRIGMVLRLFQICMRNLAQTSSLAPQRDLVATCVDLIDLVLFKLAAPDNQVRAELRQRMQDMMQAAQLSLYNRRGQYRTWPEKLDMGGPDGLITTVLAGQDDDDSLAEESEAESGSP